MSIADEYPLSRSLLITNKRGLHARAANKFVRCAGQFEAAISVSKDGQTVPGRSIMGLMMLAAAPGSSILVEVDGPDAVQALDALTTLVEAKFDED